jgi:Flp pilus assembly protein TadD
MSDVALQVADDVRTRWLTGDFQGAEARLATALAESPDDAALWEIRGRTLVRLTRYGEACHALEMASLLAPLSLSGQGALAKSYLELGRRELARFLFRGLAARRDCPTTCLSDVAAGLGRLGELELALQVCREASAREPDGDEPFYGMAYYMRRLKYPAALVRAVVSQAHRLAPDSTVYRVALAILHEELGDWEQAHAVVRGVAPDCVCCAHCVARMQAIHELAGDEPAAADCRQRLRELAALGNTRGDH